MVDGREITHVSHLFPGADEQAASVRGQSAALRLFFFFCPCLALRWDKMTQGGQLTLLCARPLAHNWACRRSAGQTELLALGSKTVGCLRLFGWLIASAVSGGLM